MTDRFFDDLFNKKRGLIKPGIEAIAEAMDELGFESLLNKQHILVGGTNGKGTTCGFLYEFLDGAGVYTSPHIDSMTERYMLPDGLVSIERLSSTVQYLQKTLSSRAYEQLSFFDIATLTAFKLFEPLERFVLEVGLGGRLDSTNCSDPDISIVTSIGLDHVDYLGSTYPEIAREKAGIFRKGRPVILGPSHSIPAEAKSVLVKIGYSSEVYIQGEHFGLNPEGEFWLRDDQSEITRTARLKVKHPSAFMRYNAANAMLASFLLTGTLEDREVDPHNSIFPGFWGRHQKIALPELGREVTLDVGHNEQCVDMLLESLPGDLDSFEFAVTTMLDKPWQKILTKLSDIKDNPQEVCFFQSRGERALTVANVHSVDDSISCFSSFEEVFKDWIDRPHSKKQLVVLGSVMGMADVRKVLSAFDSTKESSA